MTRPRTIHDFYGFPDELFAVDYPAPGDPDLAQQVADLAHPLWVGLDHDSWGIDHGTWSVLVHAFPDADIPVVQLAINAAKPFEYHFELGARLAPLRARRRARHRQRERRAQPRPHGPAPARLGYRLGAPLRRGRPGHDDVVPGDRRRRRRDHRDFALAVPTPDHFIPLLYLAGLADAAGAAPTCWSTATPTARCR